LDIDILEFSIYGYGTTTIVVKPMFF